jgi:hypothetical protein
VTLLFGDVFLPFLYQYSSSLIGYQQGTIATAAMIPIDRYHGSSALVVSDYLSLMELVQSPLSEKVQLTAKENGKNCSVSSHFFSIIKPDPDFFKL